MIDRAARAAVHTALRHISAGRLELVESWSGRRLGFGPQAAANRATVTIHSATVYRKLMRGSVGLGEAYVDGLWDVDDLAAFARIGLHEVSRHDRLRTKLAPLLRPAQRLGSLPALNTRRGARRNIAAHYDLGNEMFELFLDREWMMYSSAYFEAPDVTLEQAQEAKLARICERLELRPDLHVLEIGTGWGGLSLYMASRFGCRVTTTTISQEQREYAEGRVQAAGLEDRVRVLGSDYRELTGRYDRLVSIEMIEAVGWEYLDTFFERCAALLAPDGLMFLQAITIDDRVYEFEKSSRSFVNTLIFPGGFLPSLSAMQHSVARGTDLRPVFLEDIGPSYALTLRHWRERFDDASEQLEQLGYDQRFRRLWRMYLTFAEVGFRETRLRDLQIVFAKPGAHRAVAAASGSSSTDSSGASTEGAAR